MQKMMRLDKFMTEVSSNTRSTVKQYIKKGCVAVNDVIVKRPEDKVDVYHDHVTLDGKLLCYEEYFYYMLYKPAGVLSATEDKYTKTVLDLIHEPVKKELFPVGRLDKETEGLLLITNDGNLAHQLLSPKKHVDKVYIAKVNKEITEEDIALFESGMKVDEKLTALPAKLIKLSYNSQENISEVSITIREGKFHQIKRMFEVIGGEVLYLKRIAMGSLQLEEELGLGGYRRLTDYEVEQLKGNAKC